MLCHSNEKNTLVFKEEVVKEKWKEWKEGGMEVAREGKKEEEGKERKGKEF